MSIELAAVIDARGARAMEHVLTRNLGPQILLFAGLREETVSADVEAKIFVIDGARDSTHVFRVALQNNHRGLLLRQFVGRRQTRRSGTDDYRFEGLPHVLWKRIPIG